MQEKSIYEEAQEKMYKLEQMRKAEAAERKRKRDEKRARRWRKPEYERLKDPRDKKRIQPGDEIMLNGVPYKCVAVNRAKKKYHLIEQ